MFTDLADQIIRVHRIAIEELNNARLVAVGDLCVNRPFRLTPNHRCVCPEPVFVKRQLFQKNREQKTAFVHT